MSKKFEKLEPEAPMPEAPLPEAPLPEVPMPEVPMPEAPMPEAPLPEAPLPEILDSNQYIETNDEQQRNSYAETDSGKIKIDVPLTERLWFGWIVFFIFYPLAMYFFYKGGHKKSFDFCAAILGIAILMAICK